MKTATNATSTPVAGGDRQRAASGLKPPVSSGIPHVLARLPDLRATRQQTSEPAGVQPSVSQPTVNQPTSGKPTASSTASSQPASRITSPAPRAPLPAVEFPAELKSEFFEPQGLPSMDRLWQDTRQWFSKHAKVAMFVVALLASHSFMLMWRQAPTERQTDQVLQPLGDLPPAAEPSPLHPLPMETDVGAQRAPAADTASTSVLDEPHLALPRPHPDPISLSNTPHLTPSEGVPPQPNLAAVPGDEAEPSESLKTEVVHAQQRDQPKDALTSAPPKPAVPTIDEKDIPPWENWSDKQSPATSAGPAIEAAAQAAPMLAPPSGSDAAADLPDEARTASLCGDRPSSRAGNVQRPRAVAKLKGTINKPLVEPANERTRRSLY